MKEKIKKTLILFAFLSIFFPPHIFLHAVTIPICDTFFTPSVIKQGEISTQSWHTTGPLNGMSEECTGILSYIGGYTMDFTDPEFLKSLNAQELINGTSNSGEIKPSKIGKGTCVFTVWGPGGTNNCSASIEVVDNNLDDKNGEEFTGTLAVNGALRECPSKSCEIIRYYWETAEVKIIGIDDSNEWYKTITKDDYGNDLNGWMHYSLFTSDFKDYFLSSSTNQESSTETILSEGRKGDNLLNKFNLFGRFSGNINFYSGSLILFVIFFSFFLFRKYVKRIFWVRLKEFRSKLEEVSLLRIKFKQKNLSTSLFIALTIIIGGVGISYGAIYYQTSKIIENARQLTKEEKYDEALNKLNLAQVGWAVEKLAINRQKIADEVEKNKELFEDKSKYNQGLDEFDKGNLQTAIVSLSELPEDSFYYQKAQTKIEEAKRKTTEGELSEEKTARKEAEVEVQQKELQLADKEAEEKIMNADNDGDGLTYRRELELGTSDLKKDSDGDGIDDNLDTHPASGGREMPQTFEWSYGGYNWKFTASIHEDWFDYYKAKKPRPDPRSADYVTYNDPFIRGISKKISETAEKNNLSKGSLTASFVHSLSYVDDKYTGYDEYPKYPVETFFEKNGDCEDTSYLTASILKAMNIDTVLILLPGHMAVGVWMNCDNSGTYYKLDDRCYYYIETTNTKDWTVGEMPSDAPLTPATLIKIPYGEMVSNISPQYKKPCDSSPYFSGYYSDGSNYYSDSQCNYQANCLPWSSYISDLSLSGYYYNPQLEKTYHDSFCTQILVKGCYKSKSYSGYFYKSGSAWYYDSQCTQLYQSMTCTYPYSYIYSCTSEYSYSSKKSTCDYYASSRYLSSMASSCYQELEKCRSDINEYQAKLNEYNQCYTRKEY